MYTDRVPLSIFKGMTAQPDWRLFWNHASRLTFLGDFVGYKEHTVAQEVVPSNENINILWGLKHLVSLATSGATPFYDTLYTKLKLL